VQDDKREVEAAGLAGPRVALPLELVEERSRMVLRRTHGEGERLMLQSHLRRTASSIRQASGRARPAHEGRRGPATVKLHKLRRTASPALKGRGTRRGSALQYVELPRDVVVVHVADPHTHEVAPGASRRVFRKT